MRSDDNHEVIHKNYIKKHSMMKRFSFRNSIQYVLEKQRFMCLLIGIATSIFICSVVSISSPILKFDFESIDIQDTFISNNPIPRRIAYELVDEIDHINAGGKVPLGLKGKSKRILVTGGAGFVGSHLVDRLIARGDSVIVVDNFFTGKKENLLHHFKNPRFELIRHDVVEPILLEVDQIYHLACPASPVHYKFNPVKTIKTNVMGTMNMLGLAKRVGARFLITSTSEVYGDPLQHPQAETYWGNVNPIGVRSCYDEGKRTAETLTMDYHRGLNIEVRIARIFNTYGPRMCIDDGRVVSNFVAQALRKEPMTVYGDGKQTRSFQFVSDLVEGLMRLMEGNHVGPFNLGNPGEFTMLELAKKMSAYDNVVGGKLKLKGKALDVKAAGIKKKKKKEKKDYDQISQVTENELSIDGSSGSIDNSTKEETTDATKSVGEENAGRWDDNLTPAERRYIEQRERIDMHKMAKTANKSHRDRIEDFNQYLANMSEHYDIPKVGPG